MDASMRMTFEAPPADKALAEYESMMLLPRRQRANGGMSTAEQARRAARAEALRRQAKAFNEALGKSKFERSATGRLPVLPSLVTESSAEEAAANERQKREAADAAFKAWSARKAQQARAARKGAAADQDDENYSDDDDGGGSEAGAKAKGSGAWAEWRAKKDAAARQQKAAMRRQRKEWDRQKAEDQALLAARAAKLAEHSRGLQQKAAAVARRAAHQQGSMPGKLRLKQPSVAKVLEKMSASPFATVLPRTAVLGAGGGGGGSSVFSGSSSVRSGMDGSDGSSTSRSSASSSAAFGRDGSSSSSRRAGGDVRKGKLPKGRRRERRRGKGKGGTSSPGLGALGSGPPLPPWEAEGTSGSGGGGDDGAPFPTVLGHIDVEAGLRSPPRLHLKLEIGASRNGDGSADADGDGDCARPPGAKSPHRVDWTFFADAEVEGEDAAAAAARLQQRHGRAPTWGDGPESRRQSTQGLTALQGLEGVELQKLAASAAPSAAVARSLAAICHMLGEAPLTWSTAQRLLHDRRLAQRLLRWEVEDFVAAEGKLAKLDAILGSSDGGASGTGGASGSSSQELNVGAVRAESPVAAKLLAWAMAMRNLGRIYVETLPAVAEQTTEEDGDGAEGPPPTTSSQAAGQALAGVAQPTDDEIRAALGLAHF